MANNLIKQFKVYPSPNVGDVIFYEETDTSIPGNAKPVYGSEHKNRAAYPNHKLVYVSPEGEGGKTRWWYAADRLEQEAHNWRVSYPYAGLTTAPRFSCVFVLKREDYAPIVKGTAHPLDQGDETPEANERFKGAKLVLERQVDVGMQEIESLFIAVERIYDKIPSMAEQLTWNYERTYPYAGLTTCPRITRTLIMPRADYVEAATETADPVYTDAKLISQEQVEIDDEVSKPLYVVARRVYDEVPSIAAQEAFNAEKTFPYAGDTRFPRTERRYVVPRADVGTAVIPSAGLNLDGATFAFRREDRFQGQMEDSRYVLVTVAHDKIPALGDAGGLDFLKGLGYTVTRPYGTDDHPRVTWRVPSVKAGYTPTAEYTACPIVGYTSLLLTDEQIEAGLDNASNLNLVRVYDSLPGPTLPVETRDRFVDVPEGFVVERRLTRNVQPVKNDAAIATVGTGLPTDVGGTIVSTTLGADGSNKVIYSKGSSSLTLEIGSLSGYDYDEETGKVAEFTQEIVPAGTVGTGLNTLTGTYAEVRPLNQEFSIKTTRKATTLGTGGNAISYGTVVPYSWPAVLTSLRFFEVEAKNGYTLRWGYDATFKEEYSGPCSASVTETWATTAQALPSVTYMRPESMSFDFPMTSFRLQACLHPAIELTETVGTNHPDLAYAVTTKRFEATNFTNWPASIVASVSQVPYRGGFRMKVVTVNRPE
jgi:hypothetical protein